MLLDQYQEAVAQLLDRTRRTQRENVIAAGNMIADSVAAGGCVHVSRICHGMEGDVIYRGGGPMFYRNFSYELKVDNANVRPRDRSDMNLSMEGLAAYALKASNVRPGDVLILSSVSGRTESVVDLAFEAKKIGVKVIAFISMAYATEVEAVHSSGQKLHEMVDLVIDNCAPPAEAMMDVPWLDSKYAAASGIASDYLLWCITSVAVEALHEQGKTPGILRSANFPGGNDFNKTVVEPHYQEFGW